MKEEKGKRENDKENWAVKLLGTGGELSSSY